MAKECLLVAFLDRAQEVSKLANTLGRAFQAESERARANGAIDPSSWNRYKATFEEYCQSLLGLASDMKNPPVGSGAVGEWLTQAAKLARGIRRTVHGPNAWHFTDYFPDLNSVAWELHSAIKHVRKTLESVDPFSFLDDCEAIAVFSLLDRYPATPDGHLRFLEWVRDEVHNAADAKRNQNAKGYSNATIESMVRGIKWPEANARVAALSTLPSNAVGHVATVLRRELNAGTIEQIDELLTPAVRALRDARENLALGQDTDMGEDRTRNADAELLRAYGLPTEPAADANSGAANEATIATAGTRKPKRSTEKGEGRTKLIAALTKHHQYAGGGCLNLEPIGNNELARLADVAKRTASAFFSKKFHGHTKYRSLCSDPTRLSAALKALNGEFQPHEFYDARTPDDVAQQDE